MAGRKQTATMELAIGATIIAGVIMLIVMLMAWGNSTSFLGRHYRVVVNMVNVGGLKEGAPVKMGGFQIGRVASIQIRSGGTDMEIILDIDENRLLPKGSSAKVSTAGLVGDAFMEIIPGTSADTIRRAATVADAERLESSPLPDLSELFVKVNAFGDQLTILTTNLNDILGDAQFRRSVKSLVNNIDTVSYQANLILQRGHNVVDNIELASQNIVVLSNTLKDSVEKITGNVEDITGTVKDIASTAKNTIGKVDGVIEHVDGLVGSIDGAIVDVKDAITDARGVVRGAGPLLDNISGGVDDARRFINSDLSDTMKNVNSITAGIAKRSDKIDQTVVNLSQLSDDLTVISARVREITNNVEPTAVSGAVAGITAALGKVSGAIDSMTEVVDKIKKEPVLALSINKAADRIVKMKFDEMMRQPQYNNSDAILREINRWVREQMNQGYFDDPSYKFENRPYIMGQ